MDTPSVINSSFFPDIVYLNGSRLKEVVEVHLLLCQLHRTKCACCSVRYWLEEVSHAF